MLYNIQNYWVFGSGLQPGVREGILGRTRKHRNRLNLEPALILSLKNIRPQIEVLACQNEDQSSTNNSEPH
jgi:hypothetical protein